MTASMRASPCAGSVPAGMSARIFSAISAAPRPGYFFCISSATWRAMKGVRSFASQAGAWTVLSCKARIGEREALDHVAHQRAREVKLRALAHFIEHLGQELGEDHLGHRFHRGVARLVAAAD